MAGMAGATRWAARCAGAVVTLVVLTFGGWTHQSQGAQYLDASVSVPSDQVTPSGSPSPKASGTDGATATADPGGTAQPKPVTPTWWSGVGGSASAANGAFARWRGEPVTIGGTWDNGNTQMVEMHSICEGAWSDWRKPLDIAVGGIDKYQHETWAKAAAGAYDARWTRSLKKIRSCWGSRDESLLYLRFAHEMNLKDMPWSVAGGQEGNFVKAMRRFSDLRYKILPDANLVLCPSDGTSGDLKIDLHKIWPGKDSRGRQVIQVYSIDTYNSWSVIKNRAEFEAKLNATQSDMPLGLEAHRLMAVSWGVPFAISEWAGNGNPKDEGTGGDHPVYYSLMNEWIRAHAGDLKNPQPGQLIYEIYFNDQDRFRIYPTKFQPQSAKEYKALVWGK